jgi:hypothetical protein
MPFNTRPYRKEAHEFHPQPGGETGMTMRSEDLKADLRMLSLKLNVMFT